MTLSLGISCLVLLGTLYWKLASLSRKPMPWGLYNVHQCTVFPDPVLGSLVLSDSAFGCLVSALL